MGTKMTYEDLIKYNMPPDADNWIESKRIKIDEQDVTFVQISPYAMPWSKENGARPKDYFDRIETILRFSTKKHNKNKVQLF